MISIKNILTGMTCCLLLLASGCTEEDLNLQPISEVGDNGFYRNTAEVEGGVIAIYDGLQNVPLREFALTEMRSDNSQTRNSEGDWAEFEDYRVQPTNTALAQYWTANYNVIFRANRVLERLEAVTEADLQTQFEGEARFARALAHFNLLRAFGDVPLITSVILPTDEDAFARTDRETVLDAIIADFETAAGQLPAAGEITFGRATTGAASAMLGKALLTKGDFDAAETALRRVIDSGNYGLQNDYNDVFYNEGNDEVIFAIRYLDDDANEGQDFSFEFTVGGRVAGLNYPTDDFRAGVEEADTIRPLTYYAPNAPEENGKFVTRSADGRLAGNDWIVIRYADVLLMLSEAILSGNDATGSLDAIRAYNQVRARAGLPTLAVDGSATLTKDALLNERRYELSFENHRFYDLVRFGRAQEVLSAFAALNGNSFGATDLLLPIPQAEINVSQGRLSQNPGY